MQLDKTGLDFLAKQEGGFILHPYSDSRGIPTISAGITYYENGTKVKMTDPNITVERAEELFHNITKGFENNLNEVITTDINQNQFNALLSLSYNIGIDGFNKSTVLKRVNADPDDIYIRDAFEMWCKAGSDTTALLPRRKREVQLYFS